MPTEEIYFDPEIKPLFDKHGLGSFEALWNLQLEWFETPNQRRGGWSGVARHTLDDTTVFIKRQENHYFRDWKHFFLKRPTFERERNNILRFARQDIPSLDLLFYGRREVDGNIQAILITRALEGYRALDDEGLGHQLAASAELRKGLITHLADVLRKMHQAHLQHNCLYPKHVFVDLDAPFPVRLIDLEKVKRCPSKRQAALRDLDTLNRHTKGWSNSDRIRFLLAYTGQVCLDKNAKKLLREVLRLKRTR